LAPSFLFANLNIINIDIIFLFQPLYATLFSYVITIESIDCIYIS